MAEMRRVRDGVRRGNEGISSRIANAGKIAAPQLPPSQNVRSGSCVTSAVGPYSDND